jgi:DnaK suppressor protein
MPVRVSKSGAATSPAHGRGFGVQVLHTHAGTALRLHGVAGTTNPGMTAEQRETIRMRLEALREDAVRKGRAPIQPNRTDPTAVGVPDEDAQALSEMQQVLASKRNQGQADLVARLSGALARLARDPELFGLCEDCDEEIPLARLEAVPWATLCAACQQRRDPRRGGTRRSVTDFS